VAASETDGAQAMEPGTINAMVFINQPLNPAALMRCTATLAEAKAAVLQELAAPSLQGPDTATGTGTDQFILAAPLASHGVTEITWSGHHTKLGELVARAMMRALRETLRWQNGLEASLTRNLGWAGRGLGLDESSLREGLLALLPKDSAEMARRNFEALLHHPKVAAQVYMLRTLEERLRYGTLPATLLPELRLEQALLLAHYAASQSKSAGENSSGGEAKEISQWHQTLAPFAHDVKQLILQALALGYSAKWS
jgi:hypothetical protein